MKVTKRGLAAVALVPAVAGLMIRSASAQPAGKLNSVISRGKLVVGTDTGAPPFGFLDKNMHPTGADVETARLLANDLKLPVEFVATTSANRVPYLLTNRVDIVMSTFSILPERAKTVAFSTPYGAINSVIFAPADVKIKTPADLAGKKISVARGTGNETSLEKIAPPTAQIVRFDDEAGALTALATGQVDAYATGDTIAATLAHRFPSKHFETKFIMQSAFYSAGLRYGEPDFLHWINTCIFFHRENGNLAAIYEKFVGAPLRPLPTL